jgi:hypothetical protein
MTHPNEITKESQMRVGWSATTLRSGACHAELELPPKQEVNYVPDSQFIPVDPGKTHLPRDAGLIPTYRDVNKI